MSEDKIIPPQSQGRILAFKSMCSVIATHAPDQSAEHKWFTVSAALCWAGGCNCTQARKFEERIVTAAALYEQVGGRITDLDGKPLDLAKELAVGTAEETIRKAIRKADGSYKEPPDYEARYEEIVGLLRSVQHGCSCINDMPGDNYTCTAHQRLREITR